MDGTVASFTLRQLRKLDAAYWFAGGGEASRRASAARPVWLLGVDGVMTAKPKEFAALLR